MGRKTPKRTKKNPLSPCLFFFRETPWDSLGGFFFSTHSFYFFLIFMNNEWVYLVNNLHHLKDFVDDRTLENNELLQTYNTFLDIFSNDYNIVNMVDDIAKSIRFLDNGLLDVVDFIRVYNVSLRDALIFFWLQYNNVSPDIHGYHPYQKNSFKDSIYGSLMLLTQSYIGTLTHDEMLLFYNMSVNESDKDVVIQKKQTMASKILDIFDNVFLSTKNIKKQWIFGQNKRELYFFLWWCTIYKVALYISSAVYTLHHICSKFSNIFWTPETDHSMERQKPIFSYVSWKYRNNKSERLSIFHGRLFTK